MRRLTVMRMTLSLRSLLLPAVVAAGILVRSDDARAGSFEISPITVSLNAGQLNTLVSVRNQGTEAMRVQVAAYAWTQSPTGEMQLGPTTDLTFFPAMLSLPPGDVRNVRVGVTAATPTPTEKTYRLFVEELPPPVTPSTNTVRVLTRMGVPVFVQSAAAKPVPVIDGITFAGKKVSFQMRDRSDTHYKTTSLTLTGLGAAGETLFTQTLQAWYILAQGSRDYSVDVPDASCAALRAVEVKAVTDGGPITARLAGTCKAP
jgi:fimbrial chaperone protein